VIVWPLIEPPEEAPPELELPPHDAASRETPITSAAIAIRRR
jgi:hypothetical protein